MKLKLLALAVLSGVCMSQAVVAQEYDNRWYLSGTAGYFWPDDDRLSDSVIADRNTAIDDDFLWGVGIGKRLSPNFALDLEYTSTSPDVVFGNSFSSGLSGNADITTLELIGRFYFGGNFYLAAGIGGENDKYTLGTSSNEYDAEDSGYVARLGLGLESDRRARFDYRLEAGARYSDAGDFGTGSFPYCTPGINPVCGMHTVSLDYSGSLDYYVTASLLLKLGNLEAPVVAVAAPTCDTLDADADGVNDCNDKCPDSAAGQTIGADGCPVKLTIDLKGVNFDFDKDTLRPDAIVILDEAAAVLAKYPELKVEVAGHTDLCGDEAYNQDLSQRRSKVVYDYLGGKGIGADRLAGPNGYGESRPLEATEQTSPACKNETNRRTELNVQN